ncbi:hypothetical protein G6F70_001274 [Rhizopus microsporus]|nr:hypothetical protein G6F71_000276 [Rhizopus microsporus]KAG1203549.1 hypothetical protein G6F70_001274 [Rhizopus microsporus]KAG1215206.1 hypothetical protein G6F69_001212 [Rhizopus microsporus]KAG1237812.1 hypothetical protein G6F67_000905 [Rhizopus microsporus]KAG1268928.1 hypothetical protein G6F68_000708 [Rhizopus microsporus]
MQVQILVPRQDKRLTLNVEEDETVSSLRKRIANLIELNKKDFLLISLGKILNDTCTDSQPALITSTYRIRDKTAVIVHINKTFERVSPSVKRSLPKQEEKENKPRKEDVILDLNIVTTPYENFYCTHCHNKGKKCPECGCRQCLRKTGDPLICDQCDSYWHAQCAGLSKIPTAEYWYCPDCINTDVDLIIDKEKKVANVMSSLDNLIRIKENECNIAPHNHVGKIPGVYCGQTWNSLKLLTNWGVHRCMSFSTRIVGSYITGATSIMLYRSSSGLETFEDKGYEFIIAGRNITAKNERDMLKKMLIRQDRALALTCDAPLNEEAGGTAYNWRNSRPIRVVRARNAARPPNEFEPEQGFRYDGIYKVVKYWPTILPNPDRVVWKFMLRRDDDELAPWLSKAEEEYKKKGLRMIHEDEKENKKLVKYKIPARIQKMMTEDTKNQRLWEGVKKLEFYSEYEFLNHLFENVVTCCSGACPKPIKNPAVTPCGHVCCISCLKHTKTEACFVCRAPILRKDIKIDEDLVKILMALNPIYQAQTDKIPCPALGYGKAKRKRTTTTMKIKKPRKRLRIVIESS